ncbi:Crp/Fnr family transcriptional regulator [Jiella marina]|uniref:Crp/Fnr family transcriptional regulator n=1 Tax=Jiella sp. LLJ827 TaxID=2917712 RepID=UPI0021019F43|nr:Crp/Fnr family transcriptional regulator [Jiella sp. LLJ827]MCQ0986171.1 Crp/Fnr family transcriptional regulator [Jiella sp. LLJ827]
MSIRLVRKLSQFTPLSNGDAQALNRLSEARLRLYQPRDTIMHEGEPPKVINLYLDGWAYRHKDLANGKRQITSIFVPGDLCDVNVFVLDRMDHSVSALTSVAVAEISRSAFEQLISEHPRIAQALWWETLVTAAIQREWTTNLGQRDAAERISHLFCELFVRLQSVGLTSGNSCPLPLSQAEIGETTGLTIVSVNRVLQDFRRTKLIALKRKTLTILDFEALKQRAMFNPNYLHLGRTDHAFSTEGEESTGLPSQDEETDE